jgi:hypothetical protein
VAGADPWTTKKRGGPLVAPVGEEGTRLWLVLLQLDGRIRERMAWLLVCSIE